MRPLTRPKTITVPQLPWYGDTELELSFPDSWEVLPCLMRGHDLPPLPQDKIREAFAHPIGTPRLRELARGKREVVVIFDDMTRPTRVAELIPFVLEELREGGVKESGIRFVAGLGAHGAMRRFDFVKKLGEEVVQRFAVYNHNPYENCTYLGQTSRGTHVHINSEVMSCELKIALGCIVPHPNAGFGGGGKLICPGVASVETIIGNHQGVGQWGGPSSGNPPGGLHPSLGLGTTEENVLRLDMEEIARMAGLDMIVNAVVNMRRETVALFVGDLVEAHRAGVKLGRDVYATPRPAGADIVVANAYSKADEAAVATRFAPKALGEQGGDLVVIANTPEGQIPHYTGRSFGKEIGGRLWGPIRHLPPGVKRLIYCSSYPERSATDWVGPADSISRATGWEEALELLREDFPHQARVAVLPDATIQYFPQ